MRSRQYVVLCLAVAFFACHAVACATSSARHEAIKTGAAQGFVPFTCVAHPFAFAGQIKAPAKGADALVVYIEGDGHIIGPNNRVSTDPTPKKPVAWELAQKDTAPAIFYLARLGQFNPQFADAHYNKYWADSRFAPEIIQAMNAAVTKAKDRARSRKLHLVGFSGGGAVACLIAAERDDVTSLVTVAGLLDHQYWTEKNGYKPISGSLNPARVAHSIAHIPQIHLYGRQDRVIAPTVSAHFMQQASFVNARKMGVDAGHNDGWVKAWPGLLAGPVGGLR